MWFDNLWLKRIKITTQAAQVGTGGVTNFPVYMNLDDLGATFFSNVKSDGSDIRIVKSDGVTELPFEVVAIDTGAETGKLWFLADSLSDTENTDFYIYYGNATASTYARTATYGSDNVWDSGSDTMIAHLAGNLKESSVNDRTLALSGSSDATLTTDRFGHANSAYSLGSLDVGGKINVPGSVNLFETGDLTFDIWIRPSTVTNQMYIFDHYNLRFLINSSLGIHWSVGRMTDGSGPFFNAASTVSMTAGTDYKLTGVYHPDPSGGAGYIELRINGVVIETTSISALEVYTGYGSSNMQWGNSNHGSSIPYQGKVGGSMIRPKIVTQVESETEYANQSSPSTFYTISAEETVKILTLAGTTFLPYYKTNSAKISEKIQNTTNTCNLALVIKTGQTLPSEGSEIIYKDGARFLFGGYLTRIEPVETGEGELFIYDIEASDYSWILGQKIARKAFTNTTLKAIVEDLFSTYIDASYNFTTTNVQTGPTIDSITFDHVSIRKCLEKLSKLTGYIWWVDYEKNLFFQEKDTTEAGETITDSTDNFESVSLSYDTTQVRNRVIVIGSSAGEESASLNVETFTADGETRSWELDDLPSTIQSITLDGVTQSFSLDLNEKDTDDFVYNFNDKRVYLTDLITTPTNPKDIVVTYFPRIPIIKQRERASSIATMSALDGGDGAYEITIKESSITSKAEAAERAEQELEEFADPLLKGVFTTRTSLLSGTIFAPGQILKITLPSWGITTEAAFLIQQVDIEMVENEPTGTTEYFYTVRFGGKIVDIETFLAHLADDADEVQEADKILTIFGLSDQMGITDNAPVMTLFTPPFKYGPSGNPQGVYNKSKYA